MPKAVWNDAVLAESNHCRIVEGNTYFPPEAVKTEYLRPSSTHTTCPWKGVASYYHVVVNGRKNCNAAWHYPQTSVAAKPIQGYIAFWHGVQVIA